MPAHTAPHGAFAAALAVCALLLAACGGAGTKSGEELLTELERAGLAERGLPILVFASSDP